MKKITKMYTHKKVYNIVGLTIVILTIIYYCGYKI